MWLTSDPRLTLVYFMTRSYVFSECIYMVKTLQRFSITVEAIDIILT